MAAKPLRHQDLLYALVIYSAVGQATGSDCMSKTVLSTANSLHADMHLPKFELAKNFFTLLSIRFAATSQAADYNLCA